MPAFEGDSGGMLRSHARPLPAIPSSAFAGFRFPPEIIVLAVRWYLRFGLSYRDVEELLAERGIEVDHVTVLRWVQRFTPLLADAARPWRHSIGDTWFVDETYVKVAGRWRYVYRAIDQHGQIIDVYVSPRRDTQAARRFFATALREHGEPTEVVTDRAWTLLRVVDELMSAEVDNTEQYANNKIEADHGRLKARLRPMRGLKRDHSARVVMRGHAFMQNIRRGHYELGAKSVGIGASPTRSPNSPEPSERTQTGAWIARATVRLNATEPLVSATLRIPRHRGTSSGCGSRSRPVRCCRNGHHQPERRPWV
jgi:transposase, IS6 family